MCYIFIFIFATLLFYKTQIREAKYGKERLIPMTLGLTKQCEVFCSKIHLGSNSESYFFPAPDGRLYSTKAIYDNFRLMLFAANISHGGKGYGPRVHDFRHTFAVHSLKQWALQGQDIYVCLPILSTYLGHSGITATSQYLRLTADLFPSITDIMSKNFGSPILERPTIKSQQGKSTKTESKFNARSLIASKKIAGLNCPACNKDSQCAQVALPQSLILTAVIV